MQRNQTINTFPVDKFRIGHCHCHRNLKKGEVFALQKVISFPWLAIRLDEISNKGSVKEGVCRATKSCALLKVQLGESAQVNSSVGDADRYMLMPTLEDSVSQCCLWTSQICVRKSHSEKVQLLIHCSVCYSPPYSKCKTN